MDYSPPYSMGPRGPGDGHLLCIPSSSTTQGCPCLDNTLDVPVPLDEVDGTALGWAPPVLHMGMEDEACALLLAPDHMTHSVPCSGNL
ncbi:hypothetical protein llap_9665 [Limosa lapponica baueri]|uniref:Uncharacterized protein n=1 Tax=Limosa lapponica baueri TaxID=1758121 RepID=A0A2I0U1T4_LIMLA|nr:hypothetical protein llap_9665 [Limosa lapponica baueri]